MSVVAHFFMSVGGSEIHERLAHFFIDFYTLTEVVNISIFSVSKKYFRPAVRILKLSKSFKILLIERAVGFLPPTHTPRCSFSSVFCGVFQQSEACCL